MPLDKDSKERGLSPLENKDSEACLFKKKNKGISWWLVAAAAGSESGMGQNCNSGARLSIPTMDTEQRSSREKGEPSIQVTVVIFMASPGF